MLFLFGWSSNACCSSFSCARSKLQRPIRLSAMPFKFFAATRVRQSAVQESQSFLPSIRNVPVKSMASLPTEPRLPSGGVATKKASTAGMSVTTSELHSLIESGPRHPYKEVACDETRH